MNLSTFSSESKDDTADVPARQFRFPMALLTAIVIGLLIESVAYTNYQPSERIELFLSPDRVPNLVETIVEGKLQAASQKGEQVDVLVLGDSSGLMGVDPRIIRQQTGASAYNLCTVSWLGAEGNLALFRQFIANHGDPTMVIYHFAPSEMRYDAQAIKEFDFVRRVNLWIKAKERINQSVAKQWPELSFKERLFLPTQSHRSSARSLMRWQSARPDRLDVAIGPNESHNETLKRFERQGGFIAEHAETDWSTPPDVLAGISTTQKQSLKELANETSGRGIKLLLVANPLPEIARTEANLRRLQELEAELAKISSDATSVHLMRPVARFYTNEQLANQNHLAASAVERNTREILDTIQRWQSKR